MPDWAVFCGLGAVSATLINAGLVTCFIWMKKKQDETYWDKRK